MLLRFPDKTTDEEIPLAGVDFVNRFKTNETVLSAVVTCTPTGVVDAESIQYSGTQVLFTVTGGTVGDVTINVVATGANGSVREATVYMKIVA